VSRFKRHGLLGLACVLILGSAVATVTPEALIDRLSITTAWLCAVLLGIVLLIGPFESMRSGRRPVNHLLRRDLGIWTALIGLAHLYLGMEASMTPAYLMQFVENGRSALSFETRDALFFWGTILGFIVGLIFLMLLALSSNAAIRILGLSWWKRLQRAAWFSFALTALHGLAFQMLENRPAVWITILVLISGGVIATRLAARSRRLNPQS
jgi:sulfoxide reductase heme-binding subunit YedZ